MAKAPNTMVIVRNIFMKPLRHSLRKWQRPSDHSQPFVKEDEEHEQHWRCTNALSMAEVFKPPSAGRSWIWLGPIVHKPLRELLFLLFQKNFRSIALDVKTVKNFESKLDQKPQLFWRLAIPGVDRVPGRWLCRPNNNGFYEDSRQRHIK